MLGGSLGRCARGIGGASCLRFGDDITEKFFRIFFGGAENFAWGHFGSENFEKLVVVRGWYPPRAFVGCHPHFGFGFLVPRQPQPRGAGIPTRPASTPNAFALRSHINRSIRSTLIHLSTRSALAHHTRTPITMLCISTLVHHYIQQRQKPHAARVLPSLFVP